MPKSDPNSSTLADWTIMLYIDADDVLANFAVESLRQLNESISAPAGSASAPAESEDKASVVVAAQFVFPAGAPGEMTTRRYIFKKDKVFPVRELTKKLVATTEPVETMATVGTTPTVETLEMVNRSPKEALKDFLNSVYKNKELAAQHYALILWGHGPELLLQPTTGSPTGSGSRMYITPKELREVLCEVLKEEKPRKRSLEIIGFDACYMSMFEMAYELKGPAEPKEPELPKYMVASQEDVPDSSFPYDCLIKLFRERGKIDSTTTVASLLENGVEEYARRYRDCICNDITGMMPVTLSVLNLENCSLLQQAVSSLADELLKAKGDADLAKVLIEARSLSQDYAGGLYIDLHDFCTKLSGQLSRLKAEDKWTNINTACGKVKDALKAGRPNLILKRSGDRRSHGISIYLPYLTDIQYAKVSKPLVKGGPRTGGEKGFSDMLNGAATEYLLCARRNLILDTESYYKSLKLALDTQWYSFITKVWTNALIKTAPADLDYHYSAQQSWMNR